jgi:hypothetical protein
MKKRKQPGVRWLRRWHSAVVKECGTDDLGLLIAGMKLLSAPKIGTVTTVQVVRDQSGHVAQFLVNTSPKCSE